MRSKSDFEKQFERQTPGEVKKKIRVYFLIVCEGSKTEPNYFESFPSENGEFTIEQVLEGGAGNTLNVVDKAIELRDKSDRKYDRVWAVFDKDSFPDEDFNAAIQRGEDNGIHCAWSNEAFELWYLLHFCRREDAMSRTQYKDAISEQVNRRLGKKAGNYTYKKNDPDNYRLITKLGRQDLAIRYAKELEEKYSNKRFARHNPRTTVYKLVEELMGQDEELNKEIAKGL